MKGGKNVLNKSNLYKGVMLALAVPIAVAHQGEVRRGLTGADRRIVGGLFRESG